MFNLNIIIVHNPQKDQSLQKTDKNKSRKKDRERERERERGEETKTLQVFLLLPFFLPFSPDVVINKMTGRT